MEDIIWYLHKFLRPKHYSLLNKKCRRTYFDKYGVSIYNYISGTDGYEKWQDKFLSENKIHLRIDLACDKIYGITHFYKGWDEYREKILENIITVSSSLGFIDSNVIRLITERLPNVREISGVLLVTSSENLRFLNRMSKDSVIILHIYSPRQKREDVIEKIKENNVGIQAYVEDLDLYEDCLDFIRVLNFRYSTRCNPINLPNLREIMWPTFVPDIIAPNLEIIVTDDLIIVYRIAKKCGSKKEFKITNDVKFREDPEFYEAYNYLKNSRFSVQILPDQIESLLKLEISDKIVRTIYVENIADVDPDLLERAKKIFFVEEDIDDF